jgi:hypothetical protein
MATPLPGPLSCPATFPTAWSAYLPSGRALLCPSELGRRGEGARRGGWGRESREELAGGGGGARRTSHPRGCGRVGEEDVQEGEGEEMQGTEIAPSRWVTE